MDFGVVVEILRRDPLRFSSKRQEEACHEAPCRPEDHPDRKALERRPFLDGEAHKGGGRASDCIGEKSRDVHLGALGETPASRKDNGTREKTDREHDEEAENGGHGCQSNPPRSSVRFKRNGTRIM